MSNIRYIITAIKASGFREVAFTRNAKDTYATPQEAEKALGNVIANNNAERILECVGRDLEVRPVMCWNNGEAKELYFDTEKDLD